MLTGEAFHSSNVKEKETRVKSKEATPGLTTCHSSGLVDNHLSRQINNFVLVGLSQRKNRSSSQRMTTSAYVVVLKCELLLLAIEAGVIQQRRLIDELSTIAKVVHILLLKLSQ